MSGNYTIDEWVQKVRKRCVAAQIVVQTVSGIDRVRYHCTMINSSCALVNCPKVKRQDAITASFAKFRAACVDMHSSKKKGEPFRRSCGIINKECSPADCPKQWDGKVPSHKIKSVFEEIQL